MDDHDTLSEIRDFYQEASQHLQSFWYESSLDTRFRAGDQSLWQELHGDIPHQNKKQFSFNRIRPLLNMVSGHQRKNRKTTVVLPREESANALATQLTDINLWVMQQSKGLELISQACEESLVTGLSWISLWMDYRDDPISGNLKMDLLPHNSIIFDPHFKKRDLSDCAQLWSRKWITKKELKTLFPKQKKDIEEMVAQNAFDGKFTYLPENFAYSKKNMLALDEYWSTTTRPVKKIVDTETGEATEWEGGEERLGLFLSLYPELKVVETQKKTISYVVCVNERIIYREKTPYGMDRFPLVPFFCYFDPNLSNISLKFQGMVRGLRDSQFLYNRRKRIELEMVESQINSGLKVKEGALVNKIDAYKSGQGQVLMLKQSSQMEDVQPISPPPLDPTTIQLSQLLSDEMMKISGINEELLGAADDDKSGVLSMLRQGAGLTTLQPIFDGWDTSQKLLGEFVNEMIVENFSPGKMKKILGKEVDQGLIDKQPLRYECVVEEGILTSTQKQMQFLQLIKLREMELPIPTKALIESLVVQDKEGLLKAIQEEEEGKQKQLQVEQQEKMQAQQVVSEGVMAKAESDKALARERIARIQDNQALAIEKVTEAEKNRNLAILHEVKTIKELQEIDLNQLEKMVGLIKMLKEDERNQEQIIGEQGETL